VNSNQNKNVKVGAANKKAQDLPIDLTLQLDVERMVDLPQKS